MTIDLYVKWNKNEFFKRYHFNWNQEQIYKLYDKLCWYRDENIIENFYMYDTKE